jgi:hypothetical protein
VAKKRVAVAAFARAIKNQNKRTRFANNQISLEQLIQGEDNSLTLNDMPPNLQQLFNGLSEPELTLLANLQTELESVPLTESVGSANFTLGKF